jgi:hypothetical protein
MTSKISFFVAMMGLVSGCASYRHADYMLQFSDARTGAPPERRQLEIVFVHELFPFNAPHSIHTNLDEQGAVSLRLPDHFPTWLFLRGTNGGPYVFDLNLHSLQRDPHLSFFVTDKHTGKCQLVLTKTNESRAEPTSAGGH